MAHNAERATGAARHSPRAAIALLCAALGGAAGPASSQRLASVPDDAAVRGAVESAYLREPVVPFHTFDGAVDRGVVRLTGPEKERAEAIASRVAGVVEVRNRLAVAETSRARRGHVSDREIERGIERELRMNPFVAESEVAVSVSDGVATLSGSVETWGDRARAEQEAREGGARSVRNRIEVRAGAGVARRSS